MSHLCVNTLPDVGPYIYDVSISGFTRSSIYIYIYDISSLRVNHYTYKQFRLEVHLIWDETSCNKP